MKRAIEQIIGREGETATFFSRCPLNFSLRVAGFAPRHLSRSAASLEITQLNLYSKDYATFSFSSFSVFGTSRNE